MLEDVDNVDNNLFPFQCDLSDKGHKGFIIATPEEIFKRICNGTNHYYESFVSTRNYNLVYDLDITDDDEIKNSNAIIKDIINKSIIYLKDITGSDKVEVFKLKSTSKKLSYHIIIRHETHVFKSIYDMKEFVKNLKFQYKCVDLCIYGKMCLRLLGCSKKGKNNILKYVGRKTVDEFELFKLCMSSYIEPHQIELIEYNINREKKRARTTSTKNIKCDNIKSVSKFLKHIYKKDVEYVIKNKDGCFYVNIFDNKCLVCNKNHRRNTGSYLVISSNSKSLINVASKCFKSENVANYCLLTKGFKQPKKKEDKLLFNIFKDLFDHEIKDNIIFTQQTPEDLNEMRNINKINIEYNKYDDKYVHALNIKDYDSIGVKAEMGTGKTYSISDTLRKAINANPNKDFLVICPLIATNSEILKKLNTPENEQIKFLRENDKFDYYSDLTNNQLINSKRLVITPDSLPRLVSQNGKQHKLKKSPYVLWIDEIKSFFPYIIGNQNLSKSRKDILQILKFYIKTCKKLIISDADIDTNIMKWIKDLRQNKKTILNHNTKKTIKRTCYIYNSEDDYKLRIYDDLDNNKKLYICADSRKTVDYYYADLKKRYPNKKINKYTSDTPEQNAIHFKECNKYFTIYDVVIISPSVQYGLSYDKRHFDHVYGLFCGVTVTPRCANQMLARVRKVKNDKLFLLLSRSFPVKYITEKDKLISTFQNNTTYFTHDTELYNMTKTEINDDGIQIFDNDDFITNLIVNTTIEINEGLNDFNNKLMSYLGKQDIKIYKQVTNGRKLEKQKNKEIKDNSTINKPIINKEQLEGASRYERDRYYTHKLYGLKNQLTINTDDLQEIAIVEDLYNENTKQKFRNLKYDLEEKLHSSEDIAHLKINNNSVKKNIEELIKIVGFDDIFDNKMIILNSDDELKINDELLQDLHVNIGDKGRFRGEQSIKKNLSYCSRVLKEYYGCELNIEVKKKSKNKVRYNEFKLTIAHHPVLFELLINKANRNYTDDRKDKLLSYIDNFVNNEFKYNMLHNSTGTYSDKVGNIKNNIDNNLRFDEYLF
jgi:hypothetical protein